MYLNLDWLKTFYLISAILILAVAILVYPTLKEKSESKRKVAKQK